MTNLKTYIEERIAEHINRFGNKNWREKFKIVNKPLSYNYI